MLSVDSNPIRYARSLPRIMMTSNEERWPAIKRCRAVFPPKDANRPFKLIGVVEEIYNHVCIWIYTTMQATSRISGMQGRSRTAPSPRSDTLKGFASPHGLTLLGSNYARSPMTSRTRSRCQASRPSCQASHPSCQASRPNHTHLLGQHDSSAPLLHSATIKLSSALIFF